MNTAVVLTCSWSWFILSELISGAPLTSSGAQGDGLQNEVGCFEGNVTLRCDRVDAERVAWSYIAPGTEREQPIPGRHSYWGSNYGEHGLRLENLQRSDAGLYVCRSTADPQSFKPAGAFVVVVADKPFCRADYSKLDDGDPSPAFTISCLVVYNGRLNLTLSLRRSDDNFTVASRNYTSAVGGSWHRLERRVPLDSGARQPKRLACRAEFYSSTKHVDIAKNRPPFIEVPCDERPPDKTTNVRSVKPRNVTKLTIASDASEQTTADGIGNVQHVITQNARNKSWGKATALVLTLVIILLIVVAFRIWVGCKTQNREHGSRRFISGEGIENGAGKGTAESPDEADSNLGLMVQCSASSAHICDAQDLSAQCQGETTNDSEGPSEAQVSNSADLSTCSSVNSQSTVSLHSDHGVN